ncbi:uncharacterized protein LOC135195851 [Macrobrachium nipponense]|uniref:uncharacterized protein LOC135195851 n=1 Tax=Macrobrachium nipponense TaxID=159736 RepID=UPI0030C84F65
MSSSSLNNLILFSPPTYPARLPTRSAQPTSPPEAPSPPPYHPSPLAAPSPLPTVPLHQWHPACLPTIPPPPTVPRPTSPPSIPTSGAQPTPSPSLPPAATSPPPHRPFPTGGAQPTASFRHSLKMYSCFCSLQCPSGVCISFGGSSDATAISHSLLAVVEPHLPAGSSVLPGHRPSSPANRGNDLVPLAGMSARSS